ncbi:MAG: Anti-sigma factor antagonist [Modestobacter sp.]|nr:Anti-sigma factor antagonist [Modestobacter sp.]
MTLSESPEPGHVVAAVTGALDAATNPLLQNTLLRALRTADRLLTLDLSGVTFFGPAGVTALVRLSQHPEAAGKDVRVVATSRIVTGPLESTGLLERPDVTGMPGVAEGPAGPPRR